MQRILVTGGAGFIGSSYLNKFVPRRSKRLYINVDRLTYAGNLDNVTVSSARNYVFERVDVRNRAALDVVFKKYRPTAVVHFAAESHVDLSISNPNVFMETNVLGTHNLLLLARKYGVGRFLHVSTDEVYGALPSRKGSFTEDMPLAPRNPYSASKAAAEMLVRAYHETFGLNTVITRSSNVFGPHQDLSKVIPSFISKLLEGKKASLYGKGQHIREWLFVEDCIRAVDLVFNKGTNGDVYNISSGVELTNLELTKKLIVLTDRDENLISYVKDRPGHDFRYSSDSSKLRSKLGWKPTHLFGESLAHTVEFYKNS